MNVIVHEAGENSQGVGQLQEPELLTTAAMKRFIQNGTLAEIRSLGDAVAAAIMGTSDPVMDSVSGYDPQEIFMEAVRRFNEQNG